MSVHDFFGVRLEEKTGQPMIRVNVRTDARPTYEPAIDFFIKNWLPFGGKYGNVEELLLERGWRKPLNGEYPEWVAQFIEFADKLDLEAEVLRSNPEVVNIREIANLLRDAADEIKMLTSSLAEYERKENFSDNNSRPPFRTIKIVDGKIMMGEKNA